MIFFSALIPSEENPLGEDHSRKYTPLTPIYHKGKFDLLIKIYYANVDPNFPKGGIVTQWINNLSIGSEVLMRGPIGRLFYYGDGLFKMGSKDKPVTWKEKQYNKIGMLAGGTGITPLFQILQNSDLNNDTIEFSLIFGNKTSKDILLKNQLDEMHKKQNFKFSNLIYTIDKEEDGWTGKVGLITKEKIAKYIPEPSEDTLIIICGSGKMCKKYLFPLLLEMGYSKENIFIF